MNILPAQDPMFVPPFRALVASPDGGGSVRNAAGETTDAAVDSRTAIDPPPDLAAEAARLLDRPGLVIITGGPGCGRSRLLRRLGHSFRGPVFTGGGLAMLQSVPAFALTRAVRAHLPTHDTALLVEAVRSRVRNGLLLIDDLQWADSTTLAALAPLAAHCRIAATLRTPHRLPDDAVTALREAATGWLTVPALTAAEAAALARSVAPGLTTAEITAVVRHAGGVPLAVEALARRAAAGRDATADCDIDQVEYAVASALSNLTRPARTAMAALGLLGRPATITLLGAGVDELTAAGLVTTGPDGLVHPVSPYVAEVAAGVLDDATRKALHRRLADLVPPREAVRHLAAAGDTAEAYRQAVAAAENASTAGERAELLLLACHLPGARPDPATRLAAATAALAAGQPRAAARVLNTDTPLDTAAAIVRAEALLQLGDLPAARAAAAPVPDSAPPHVVAGRDRILLLVQLAEDPAGAAATAEELTRRHGAAPAHAGLRCALAATAAGVRAAGWESALTAAADAARAAGDALSARWSDWLLVETLAADGRLDEAADAAHRAAQACAADLAYSWQTRFLAAGLWCRALRGGNGDEVLRRATDLTDRTLPTLARGYAVAAASLIEADAGLLGTARARLAAAPAGSVADAALDWVTREAAWLDGQPNQAVTGAETAGSPLVNGLRQITACWAAFDGADASAPTDPPHLPAIEQTLKAWTTRDPQDFAAAAVAWHDRSVREEVRSLLAQGLHEPDRQQAVPPLLAAEQLAEQAGLVVLLGRTRRALRRHSIRREIRGVRDRDELTSREREVLRLVAAGEPTRRIAGQLGISAETVETHIRSGMRKLGARTRTEAAALALEVLA
jgi:DNA-binding CsgD family transcriptional regulator